jgi:hypothetical protein
MMIPTRLRVIACKPIEMHSDLSLQNSVVKTFLPVTLCTTQAKVDSQKLLYFIQHPDEINNAYPCIVLKTIYSLVLNTSMGLYLFDGNHRANAALMTKQRLMAHYIDLRA